MICLPTFSVPVVLTSCLSDSNYRPDLTSYVEHQGSVHKFIHRSKDGGYL